MPYIIESWDKPDHQSVRKALRSEHLAFLSIHAAKLLACGAKLDDDGIDLGGGIYIVDVDRREEAEAFIAEDPFSKNSLFARVAITRWRKSYVGGRSFLPAPEHAA